MEKIMLGVIFLLLALPLATANVYITEVMHSPTQTESHSDGEWIELYNSGTEEVNLSNWTLDGKDFDDVSIGTGEYLVVARELLDGSDADTESFETAWGNGNGIWDESFNAVDGSMSLSTEDSIVLTNGDYVEEISYNSSFGGESGRTIERISLDVWEESSVGGTPGEGSFTLTSSEETIGNSSEGEIALYLEVSNAEPEVYLVNITTDDSSSDGIQIMPNVELDKEVGIEIYVRDGNGYTDIENVSIDLGNESFGLEFLGEVNETVAVYSGSFIMSYYDLAGDYNLNVSVDDGSSVGFGNSSFEYLGIISTRLNVSAMYFDLGPGEVSEYFIEIENSGNVLVDVEVSGEEFVSLEDTISLDNLEVYSSSWLSLVEMRYLDLALSPGMSSELAFRLSVPYSVSSGSYQGSVVINAVESE
jgi:hypothetical protein